MKKQQLLVNVLAFSVVSLASAQTSLWNETFSGTSRPANMNQSINGSPSSTITFNGSTALFTTALNGAYAQLNTGTTSAGVGALNGGDIFDLAVNKISGSFSIAGYDKSVNHNITFGVGVKDASPSIPYFSTLNMKDGVGFSFQQSTGSADGILQFGARDNAGNIVSNFSIGTFTQAQFPTKVTFSFTSTQATVTFFNGTNNNINFVAASAGGATLARFNGAAGEGSGVSVSYSALSFDPADTANFYLGANSNASVSRALAIDDLVLSATATAIPEPSSFAALAGLGALGLVACLRRRRSF
jgi:hypothetical protein